ncbi:MAG: hypothetical protein WDZ35_05445 [Crocinitomicaceae bacterium]
MKYKQLFSLLPAAALLACGGGEDSTSESNESSTESIETTKTEYASTYESCDVTESSLSMTSALIDESFSSALAHVNNSDLSSYQHVSAEIREDHGSIDIKFSNNPEITDQAIKNYAEGDTSFTITIRTEKGELQAGAYTEDDLDINFRKAYKKDGTTMYSAGVGSNKTPRSVIINEISEDRVCGVFMMATVEKEGVEEIADAVTASFNVPVTVKKPLF